MLWRLHHIIAFRSQLLRWKRGFQPYCFLKRHNQKRSWGRAVTLRWLCAHSGNSLWALRSSVDIWVAFYLESVLSWQRWQSAGARLENSGMTTVTLHKFKPDLLLLQNPQMSCIFVLRPSNQKSVEIGETRWCPLVNTICFLDCLPSPPSWTHSTLEKGNKSHETGEFKQWKFRTTAAGFRSRETSRGQWPLTVCNKPELLNRPVQSLPSLFSVMKKMAMSAVQ